MGSNIKNKSLANNKQLTVHVFLANEQEHENVSEMITPATRQPRFDPLEMQLKEFKGHKVVQAYFLLDLLCICHEERCGQQKTKFQNPLVINFD